MTTAVLESPSIESDVPVDPTVHCEWGDGCLVIQVAPDAEAALVQTERLVESDRQTLAAAATNTRQMPEAKEVVHIDGLLVAAMKGQAEAEGLATDAREKATGLLGVGKDPREYEAKAVAAEGEVELFTARVKHLTTLLDQAKNKAAVVARKSLETAWQQLVEDNAIRRQAVTAAMEKVLAPIACELLVIDQQADLLYDRFTGSVPSEFLEMLDSGITSNGERG